MQEIYVVIEELIDYAKKNLLLDERDVLYARNNVLEILNLESYTILENVTTNEKSPENILAHLRELCVANNIFDIYDTPVIMDKIMASLSLKPSEVNNKFNEIKASDSAKATEWLYDYCVKNDYVKKSVLDKNPRFDVNGLTITINKAKPEFKDPKKASAGNAIKGGYPSCTICRENEGFAPRNKRNLRTVSLCLNNTNWFFQFSPYGYFYQHGIAVNESHIPMHVDRNTFYNLMSFVDQFPHYFIGSNAALPRIGGSVLAHDHYQGGGEVLPLFKAGIKEYISCKYDDVSVGVLDWPGTVIRLISSNKDHIADIADMIRVAWINYTNVDLGIIASDNDGIHSAISPTVIKKNDKYELNIILRNNITTSEYPDGVFHAHPEFHSVKKESIGLIEAQGLFILPGRLEAELDLVENCILAGKLDESLKEFELVYNETSKLTKELTKEAVHKAMQEELGSICYRILENTAVFKDYKITVDFLKEVFHE